MSPRIEAARNGQPTLVAHGEHLEDADDPVAGARAGLPAERVRAADAVVLFGAGLGYRARRLRELGAKHVLVFEPSAEIAALARQHAPEAFEGTTLATERGELLGALIQLTIAGQTTALLVPPPYRRAFPAEHDAMLATMREAESLKMIQQNTIVERLEQIIETGLGNLGRLAQVPLFERYGRPLEGTPAFIVAAGPSLDLNAALLAEASEKGAIFAVNTSAPAVVAAGARIDVLTSIEAIDVSAQLARSAAHAKVLALDLTANAHAFDVPAAARAVFLPPTEPFLQLSRRLGSRALPYGASVATAALSLAYEWGADPIVMVGQDLAYTRGRYYASHTGSDREHMRVAYEDGALEFSYNEDFLEHFRAAGIKPPPARKPGLLVPSWGGAGEVPTSHDLVLFRRWFEAAAVAYGGQRTFLNASEGGSHIEGFADKPLREVLDMLPTRTDSLEQAAQLAEVTAASDVELLRQGLAGGSKRLARAADKCLQARGDGPRLKADRALQRVRAGAEMVEVHSSAALIRLRQEANLGLEERRRRTFVAIRDSARRVGHALKGPGA